MSVAETATTANPVSVSQAAAPGVHAASRYRGLPLPGESVRVMRVRFDAVRDDPRAVLSLSLLVGTGTHESGCRRVSRGSSLSRKGVAHFHTTETA